MNLRPERTVLLPVFANCCVEQCEAQEEGHYRNHLSGYLCPPSLLTYPRYPAGSPTPDVIALVEMILEVRESTVGCLRPLSVALDVRTHCTHQPEIGP